MEELSRKQYYKHDNYVATYYALYIALERWLASVVFRNDISRVFLASPQYAYRRRFELTDPTTSYTTLPSASLRFPFANYWPLNDGWMPDTRLAANPASMLERGISVQSRILQAMMVTTDIELLLHFDREDDARLAYESLLWQSFRERYHSTTVAWRGEVLEIPMNIKVQNLEFNPEFKEKDWLETNRIFIIKAVVQLRSYILKPPVQPNYNSDEVEDNDKFYLTEEVILSLMKDKHLIKTLSVKSLFDYNAEILIDYATVSKTTQSTATLEWKVDGPLSQVIVQLEGQEAISLPGNSNLCILRGLIKNSKYTVTLTFISTDGTSKVIALEIETSKDTAGDVDGTETLVGVTW